MFSLQGKVIAIAGAASGLGQAAALHLAKLGAQISVTDRSEKCLEELATELRSLTKEENFLCRVVDIRDRAAVEAWTNETVTRFGRLDGAVNAAGVHPQESGKEPIWSVTDDDWEFAQSVNVRGTLNLVRAQLRYMVDARTRDEIPTGSIIVFGSNSSVMGAPNLSAYTTSKHAILGLMRAAAMDAAHYNIRVNAICPYVSLTPFQGSLF